MNDDFRDLLSALRAAEARFLIVGAYAVAIHGRPRATGDLDVWVEPAAENAPRVMKALVEFGAPLLGLTEAELSAPGVGLHIGHPPRRIDILTKITAVTFDEAWERRVDAPFGGIVCSVIGRDDLLKNKRALARPKDLADVDALTQTQPRGDP
ncbi:MAG: hypothetical protein HY744_32965 [Deltaproteobacteria bacterium]|nr:hypothetical protein [Deltaproteobacteria bacterium]